MNGRVISNSINTARTLAKSEDKNLRVDDLKTIVQVWEDFEKTLASKDESSKTRSALETLVQNLKKELEFS